MALSQSNTNNLLGRIVNVYNGHAHDQAVRMASSSGGFMRELCKTLLASRMIDGIIAITHDGGLEYSPKLIQDIALMPNSIYHNINFQNAFRVLQQQDGQFLLIGLPCQITSIDLLLKKKKFSALKAKIFARVSLICGYSFDRNNIKAFAHYNRIDIAEITYREHGRHRKTRVKSHSGELLFDIKKPRNLKEDIHNQMLFDPLLQQRGCLYCVDHLCYGADIIVGDAWQKRYKNDHVGTNLLICRTKTGADVISRMDSFRFEKGYLEEIINSQSEAYAIGSLGETMKTLKMKGTPFSPDHKRTESIQDIKRYKLKLSDLIKIKLIRSLLRKGRLDLARNLYLLLNLKNFILAALVKKLKKS